MSPAASACSSIATLVNPFSHLSYVIGEEVHKVVTAKICRKRSLNCDSVSAVSLTQQSNAAGVTLIAVLSDAPVGGTRWSNDAISAPILSLVSSETHEPQQTFLSSAARSAEVKSKVISEWSERRGF